MRSIILLMVLIIFVFTSPLWAQKNTGIIAGLSFSNVTLRSGNSTSSPKSKTGFTAGIVVDAPFHTKLGFQTGVNFIQKGYIVKDATSTETVNLNYCEIPLDLIYGVKEKQGFFIGAGPSIAFGISGKDKLKLAGNTSSDNTQIQFGSGLDQVKPFDFGIHIIAGYRVAGGFMVSGIYNLGLSKINNDNGGARSIKNKYFSMKIGLMF